jgi:hypothetical protein
MASERMGKKKLAETFPNGSAIDFLYKTQKGNFIEGSTDLPEDLAEEVLGKIVAHISGEDWRAWKPETVAVRVEKKPAKKAAKKKAR